MPTKILLVESPSFVIPATILPGEKRCNQNNWKESLAVCFQDPTPTVVVVPHELSKDPLLQEALSGNKGSVSVAVFHKGEDLAAFADSLKFLFGENRSIGVKDCLNKGSTIYSESFFNPSNVGGKLDPCYNYVRRQLSPGSSLDALGSLQSLLFLGLQSLPGFGEAGTGERVDVQLGGDEKSVAFTVRFDLAADKLAGVRANSLLELAKSSADIMEVRYLKDASKLEILCWFTKAKAPEFTIDVQTFHQSAGMENKDTAKEYEFKTFGSLTQEAPEEKRVIKGGGFKKKFSDKIKVKGGDAPADDTVTKIKGDGALSPDELKMIMGDESPPPPQKLVISGNANLAKKEAAAIPAPTPEAQVGKEKSQALLEDKIQGLEATLKQRDELVAKLNKEIEEIKDPMKMGVISGIKDNQLDGLKGNITRLEGELAEAQGREKELMTVVDKAIQLKDDAIKKYKELEAKLKTAQGGNNSKVVMLEKQLEEQKRQNKELSKKVSVLTEQLNPTGKKAA